MSNSASNEIIPVSHREDYQHEQTYINSPSTEQRVREACDRALNVVKALEWAGMQMLLGAGITGL